MIYSLISTHIIHIHTYIYERVLGMFAVKILDSV